MQVLQIKGYIAEPKPNGCKSLHAIVEIPVFLSTGAVPVIVEVQICTVAIDFWASLEHKIFYKCEGEVPGHLVRELAEATAAADELDRRMEQLHTHVRGPVPAADVSTGSASTRPCCGNCWSFPALSETDSLEIISVTVRPVRFASKRRTAGHRRRWRRPGRGPGGGR